MSLSPLAVRLWARFGLGQFSPAVTRAIQVDVSAALLLTAFMGLTAPFTGLILRRDLGATPFQLALMASANAGFLLLSLVWARVLAGRAPLPYVVWPGVAARGLFLLVPLISTPWPFVGLLVGASFLGTIQGPAQATLVQQLYPREERGRALSAVRVSAALVAIGLSTVAGTLLGIADYRWIFCSAALLGMAASLKLRDLPLPATAPPPSPAAAGLRHAWRTLREDRQFRRLLTASCVFGSGIWLQMPAMPLLLSDELHATTGQVGVFAAVGAVAGLVANACWGRFADRRSSLHALRLVYVVGVLAAASNYLAVSAWMLSASYAMEAVMTTGLDMIWMMAVIDAAGPRRTAQYMAIAATLAGARGIVAPLAASAVIESFGVRAVFPLAAALMLAGAWLVTRQLRDLRESPVPLSAPA